MKKTKFTGQQIAFALRQAETGTRVAEVCRKPGDFRCDVLQLLEKGDGFQIRPQKGDYCKEILLTGFRHSPE